MGAAPARGGDGAAARRSVVLVGLRHDDHGAAVPSAFSVENIAKLAPTQGVYEYPSGPAKGNGADVFVAATGATPKATFWRVDWNTLDDPRVPIAVWIFDTDGDASTGSSDWPSATGVRSSGIERALVVSSRGAWLHDLGTCRSVDATDRGLEYDLVVLVEPDLFGDGIEGAVDRYVAMTRATQQLVILRRP